MKTAKAPSHLWWCRYVGALAGALAALLVSATPASAAERTVRDPRGDMEKSIDWAGDYRPAPRRSNGDIVRARFRHTESNVVVRTRFAELKVGNPNFDGWDLFIDIKDQHGTKYAVFLSTNAYDNRRGSVQVFGPNRQLKCGTRHRVDYVANTARVVVPRSCLHTPRSVRFRVGIFMDSFNAETQKEVAYTDGLNGPCVTPRGWTTWARRG